MLGQILQEYYIMLQERYQQHLVDFCCWLRIRRCLFPRLMLSAKTLILQVSASHGSPFVTHSILLIFWMLDRRLAYSSPVKIISPFLLLLPLIRFAYIISIFYIYCCLALTHRPCIETVLNSSNGNTLEKYSEYKTIFECYCLLLLLCYCYCSLLFNEHFALLPVQAHIFNSCSQRLIELF